jgi:hypothetical protein
MLQIFHLIKGRGVTQAAGREPTDASLRFGIRFQWRPMLPAPDDDISFRNGNRKSSGKAFADASRSRKILGNKQPHVSVLTRNRSCSQDRTLADFDRRLVILAFFDIDQWISTIDCDIVFFDCDRNIDVFFD